MFGHIRQLPFHILTELRLNNPAVSNHMEVTNYIVLNRSTPPCPTPQTISHVAKPQTSRGKVKSKQKTPLKVITKGVGASKKSKTSTVEPMHTEEPINTKEPRPTA